MISCRHKVTIFFQSFAYSTYIIYTHGHSFSANGVPRAEVSNFLSFVFIGKTKERKLLPYLPFVPKTSNAPTL